MALHSPYKGHVYGMSGETEDRVSSYLTSAGSVHAGKLKFFATLCICTHDNESSMGIDIGFKNKF